MYKDLFAVNHCLTSITITKDNLEYITERLQGITENALLTDEELKQCRKESERLSFIISDLLELMNYKTEEAEKIMLKLITPQRE